MPALLPADRLLRRMAAATAVNTFGNGLFLTISALFFTRIVGLTVLQVGVGLTVAGLCGVVAGVPAGRLADRFGTKPTYVVFAVVEALGLGCYPFVHSFGSFLAVVCLVDIADRSGSAVRGALIATAMPPTERVAGRAYLRSVTNVGIGAGAAVAAVALHADTRAAYVTLVLVDALTFLVAAVIIARLPAGAVEPVQARAGSVRRALSDRPYLLVTVLNAVLMMQFAILEVGLPLWVVGHTRAPKVLVAVALIVNTVLIVLFQVPAGRWAAGVASAVRWARNGSLLLAVGCVLFGLAAGRSAVVAVVLILAGTVVEAFGEVTTSAAGWTLSYDLADPTAPGVYQGLFSSGAAAGLMLAPLLITATAIHLGLIGWVVLGALLVAAGSTLAPATRWAVSRLPVATR